MAHRLYPRNLPSTYATEKLTEGRARAAGPLGASIARATAVVAPGVPTSAWLGFASNGGVTEITSANELGAFGTEGARIPSLQRDPAVVAILGRPAGDWRVLDDQAAMGIVNVLRHATEAFASQPAAMRPSSPSSPWNVAIGVNSWSSPANTLRGLSRHPELALVPEGARWSAFYRAIARDAQEGTVALANDHSSEAYTVLRTQQKLEVARALGPAFFGPSDPEADEVLARAVVGDAIPSTSLRSQAGAQGLVLAESGLPIANILIFGALSILAIEVWRRRNRWSRR